MDEGKVQLTAEQLTEVARELGVEVVDENKEFDIHSVLGAIDNVRKPFIQKEIEETVVPELVEKQVGRMVGVIRHELKKRTGYDNKDEHIEVVFKKGFDLYDAKAKEGLSADIQTLQQRIEQLAEEKEQEKTQAVQEWQSKYTELNQRILDKEAVELLYKEVSGMKLRGDMITHTQDLYESLRRDYVVSVEGNELKFFDKSNPNLPAQLNKKSFNLAEYSTGYFERRGTLEKDMRSVNPAKTKLPVTVPVGNKTQPMSTAAAKAAAFLAEKGIEA